MGFGRRDIQTLRRIIATLVALASLADRAAGLPFPLRWFVLSILRPAEAVAREFVIEETQWPWLDEPLELQNGPADATILALRFCALAEALVVLLSLETACQPVRPEGVSRSASYRPGRVADGGPRPSDMTLPPLRGPPASLRGRCWA